LSRHGLALVPAPAALAVVFAGDLALALVAVVDAFVLVVDDFALAVDDFALVVDDFALAVDLAFMVSSLK
jgi:hypothetical protein